MCHHLMSMQECLVAFYEYPDEMHELIDCITQFELDYAAELCKYVKPDALFHHDDWGSQISTFLVSGHVPRVHQARFYENLRLL